MREKLLKEIVESVEVFDWKYSGDSLETSKEYKMLKYLSEESLKQIKQELESYVLGWDDFNEVLESMIKHVKYIPVIGTNSKGKTFLGLSYKRYLVMTDRGEFCLLHEPDEEFSCAWCTGKAMPKELFEKDLNFDVLGDLQFYVWAYLFDCCNILKSFWRVYMNREDMLCRFLNKAIYETFGVQVKFDKKDVRYRIHEHCVTQNNYLMSKVYLLTKVDAIYGQLSVMDDNYLLSVENGEGTHSVCSINIKKENFTQILSSINALSYDDIRHLCIVLLFGVLGVCITSKGWYSLNNLFEYDSGNVCILENLEQIV